MCGICSRETSRDGIRAIISGPVTESRTFSACLYTIAEDCFEFYIYITYLSKTLLMFGTVERYLSFHTNSDNIYIYIYIYSCAKARFSSADAIPKPAIGQEPDLVPLTLRPHDLRPEDRQF
jgi:hypothetical protein